MYLKLNEQPFIFEMSKYIFIFLSRAQKEAENLLTLQNLKKRKKESSKNFFFFFFASILHFYFRWRRFKKLKKKKNLYQGNDICREDTLCVCQRCKVFFIITSSLLIFLEFVKKKSIKKNRSFNNTNFPITIYPEEHNFVGLMHLLLFELCLSSLSLLVYHLLYFLCSSEVYFYNKGLNYMVL